MDAPNSNNDDEIISNNDNNNDNDNYEAIPSNNNNDHDDSSQASATDDDEQGPIISNNNKTNDDAELNNDNDDHDHNEVAIAADAVDVIVVNKNRRSTNQKGDLPKIVIEQIISFIIERSTLTSTTTTNDTTSTGTKSRPNTTNTNTNTNNATTAIDLYVPKRGTLSLAAKTFHTSSQNVSRIWLLAVKNKCNPEVNDYILTSKRKGNPNGNRKWDRDELKNELKTLPYEQRSSLRIMSNALGSIPRTTLNSMLKEGYIRCYIAPDDDGDYSPADTDILPILNEENMLQRIYYCYNRIHKLEYNNNNVYYYDDRYNEVHLDQKWFYVKKKKIDHQERYYLTEDEPDPPPAPKRPRHERHDDDDSKVMFLLAVARPCFDNDGNCIFDGKIGIWPFVYEEQQNPADVLDSYVPVKDVTTNLYLYYMKYKVIPAIKQYFNNKKNMKIYIQHDSVSSSIQNLDLNTNPEWIDFCHYEEIHNQWSFIHKEQPPNSRDLNVCQFSFFPKIQLIQRYKKRKHQIRNVSTFIRKVIIAWNNEYESMLLNKAWLAHNDILDSILNDNGNNEYNDLPFCKKQQDDINYKRTIIKLPPKIIFVNDGAIETLKQFQLL